MKSKNFLFITGCARSGTSALAELMGNHPKIVMGMERYGIFYDEPVLAIGPEHFERDRFFEMREGDTFYTDFDQFHEWDANIRTKFDEALFVGDKRPNIHNHYDQIFQRFPSATIYYIYRDIYQVAASWDARHAIGTDWRTDFDYKASVSIWNDSIRLTLRALEAGDRIIPINYAEYFRKEGDLTALLLPLGLEVTDEVARYYRKQKRVREDIYPEPRQPTDEQHAYVSSHADFDALNALARY
jgi:Sulfotransferase family